MIEHLLDLANAHAVFAHEVRNGTRIKRPGSRSHQQPVKRGKTHRRIDAASVTHGAQARAVAKMCNDHAAMRQAWVDRTELLRDELVR